MSSQRPKQFGGVPRSGGLRFGGLPGHPGQARLASSATVGSSPAGGASRASQLGLGLGKSSLGLGKGKGIKRHMKIQHDTIRGVTKGDIRRLARRGGVKRIAGTIYDDVRNALKDRLRTILRETIAVVECSGRKTVSVMDIIFVLNRQGRPIYGFDPSFAATR